MATQIAKELRAGDRVFAKLKGYPHWPAKILEDLDPEHEKRKKYKVLFYGTFEIGHIPLKDLFRYEENREKYGKCNTHRGFNEGLQQIEHSPEVQGLKDVTVKINKLKINPKEKTAAAGQPKKAVKKSPMPFKLKIAAGNTGRRKSKAKTLYDESSTSDSEVEDEEITLDLDSAEELSDKENEKKHENVHGDKENEEALLVSKKKPKAKAKNKTTASSPMSEMAKENIVKKELSELEKLHRQNLADNKAMLARLMDDLKHMAPIPSLNKPKQVKKPKERRSDSLVVRRNPSRNMRYSPLSYSPPRTRSTGGSLPSSPVAEYKMPSFEEEDDGPVPLPRPRRSIQVEREIKSADEITEEDLEMVADHVKMKRYDTVHGTTCHQCRQKTIDQKTICRNEDCFGVRGQFCGPCLRNRYGEDVRVALKDNEWNCPPCRGICNCSFCRRKSGRSCTGILIHLAKEHGFDNVNDYLQSLRKKNKADVEDDEEEVTED